MFLFDNRLSTDIYQVLALEEILLRQWDGHIAMLWQSERSLVVGKHQNTLAEINLPFAREHQLQVARRLSGGGTVYHDLGNLNFTFIQGGEKGRLVDFARYLEPVIRAINQLGLDARMGTRNEIMLGGKKISGNAEHTYRNRVLHHGTLLYNSDLKTLIGSLRINPLKYRDKGIKSVQAQVGNLSDSLPGMGFDMFRNHLANSLCEQFGDVEMGLPDPDFWERALVLAQEKYRTWDWIFGRSPDYTLHRHLRWQEEDAVLKLDVRLGLVTGAEIVTERGVQVGQDLLSALKGQRHDWDTVATICAAWGHGQVVDFF